MVDPVSLPVKRVSAARILVSSGLGLLFDAFDVGILSYVLVVLAKQWHLTHTVTGLVGSVSSLGMAVGSALAGLFADRFGRRSLFLVTILIYSLATGLSAFAAGIGIFFVLRFFVGLGLGGELPVATTYVLESSPDEVRARRVVFLESFWAVGSLAAALVSYFVIPASGWRAVFLIGAIPALYTIVLRFALPEAARYARLQRRSTFGESVRNIWSRKLARRSLVSSVVWFVMNYSYYGMFLWLPSVLYDKGYSLVHSLGYSLIMTLAQIPGYMTAAWLVERWGRKRTLVAAMILTALSALAFGFAWNTASLIVFGLLLSFFMLAAFAGTYAFTVEQFPTMFRATGMGWAAGFGRFGSAIAPFATGWLLGAHLGYEWVFGVFFAVLFVGFVIVTALGKETKGAALD
ncbi:MFS transporter [Alicyclobacillus acidocaldarius]|uniref:Major facilitator superfamily MFS_1 n=1 Tax=Alicyclobacillus acidocaldarius subsp. acidocaldarius (strain ATCC 27009 / DSM 446 / BCRC 14685 / JCM 5260 / KCTC 1825 / NBRC 15652 / NCIMB 11725 / NRRL B-14509 / 104-IA) TaxID=521098 RepID=C8WQE3_ALIAD|nr:MFS transporter [Alicyclobacillus acidocaldarius]ACV59088.1 major facilitator superfamily MFS_1 [Alicyclobacillus acidocaldarius subsp. acidocaldarius DSM 446]